MGIENPMVEPIAVGSSDAYGRKVEECEGCGKRLYEGDDREYFERPSTGEICAYCEDCVANYDMNGDEVTKEDED